MRVGKEILHSLTKHFLSCCKYYLKDDLLAIYFYGSILTADFQATSDVDFVVLLRIFNDEIFSKIRLIHQKIRAKHPWGYKLEGGYHLVSCDSAIGNAQGVWVDSCMDPEICFLEIEPDSAECIIKRGKIVYGSSLEEYYPIPTSNTLTYFSEIYLLSFVAKIPERTNSDKHFFSSILNACRAICYLKKGCFPTKTGALRVVEFWFPEHKLLLEKAIQFRNGNINIYFTNKDVNMSVLFINSILSSIFKCGGSNGKNKLWN